MTIVWADSARVGRLVTWARTYLNPPSPKGEAQAQVELSNGAPELDKRAARD